MHGRSFSLPAGICHNEVYNFKMVVVVVVVVVVVSGYRGR